MEEIEERVIRIETTIEGFKTRMSDHAERHERIEATVSALMKRIDRAQWIMVGLVLAQVLVSEASPFKALLGVLM